MLTHGALPATLSQRHHARGKFLSLAEVKCPAGCCEWKHKANELPLDTVWEFLVEHDLTLHHTNESVRSRDVTKWFREDCGHTCVF